MITIIFDADGVLYDSVKKMFDITNITLAEFNLGPISFETFRNAYNPENWNVTFKIYGLKDSQFEEYYNRYKDNELKLPYSKLIPPKKLFPFLKKKGFSLHILTTAKIDDIENRLKVDNLREYFDKVISVPNGCKSTELVKLVKESSFSCYFIGDSISDAKAVIEARRKVEVFFLGIVHKITSISFRRDYHVSTESEFNKVIESNKGDRLIQNLTELAKLEK